MGLQQDVAFPSAARTATPTAAIIDVSDDVDTGEVVVVVTAITSTPSVTFNLEGQDATGAWYLILASAAVATVSVNRYLIGPNLNAAANVAAAGVLPRLLRVRPVHGNANSITYSVAFRAR